MFELCKICGMNKTSTRVKCCIEPISRIGVSFGETDLLPLSRDVPAYFDFGRLPMLQDMRTFASSYFRS